MVANCALSRCAEDNKLDFHEETTLAVQDSSYVDNILRSTAPSSFPRNCLFSPLFETVLAGMTPSPKRNCDPSMNGRTKLVLSKTLK